MSSRLELRIPPPVIAAACAALIAGLAALVPAGNLPFPGHRALAVVLAVAGLLFALIGVMQFHRAGTTIHPLEPERSRQLVTGGIYQLSRNPRYVGMALVLAGFAAWWATVPGLAAIALFVVLITRLQILPEERVLTRTFGEAFVDYQRKVRRWI